MAQVWDKLQEGRPERVAEGCIEVVRAVRRQCPGFLVGMRDARHLDDFSRGSVIWLYGSSDLNEVRAVQRAIAQRLSLGSPASGTPDAQPPELVDSPFYLYVAC